jgi:DNA-binding PucR family transcriptional regulator
MEAATGPALGAVLARIGPTVISHEAGPELLERTVSSFLVHDAAAPQPVDAGALVAVVGLAEAAGLAELVRDLARQGAVAVLVRHPVEITGELRRAADSAALPVLGLPEGTSWAALATTVAGVLAAGSGTDPDVHAAATRADLFPLADALAAVLRAPVTIEDLATRVLAFSADQTGADDIRRETILGREVPRVHQDASRRQGHFRTIYASDRPVFIERREPGRLSRAAIRIRAGDELLGSIWAAVREPLTPPQERAMMDAAAVVATALVRARVASDAERRHRLGLVGALLEGGSPAREAARQLDVGRRSVFVAVFAGPDEPAGDAQLQSGLQRIAGGVDMYFAARYPRSVAAVLGNLVYVVVPIVARDVAPSPEQIVAEFVERPGVERPGVGRDLIAGVGRLVRDVGDLARSRKEADAALRVLRSRPDLARRVAGLESVEVESLLLRLTDALRDDGRETTGALAVLAAHDTEHGTQLVATVRAWLDEFGDVGACAARFHVHKNTFRYRLARAVEIGGLDLSDAETRFGLMLQLRLSAPA